MKFISGLKIPFVFLLIICPAFSNGQHKSARNVASGIVGREGLISIWLNADLEINDGCRQVIWSTPEAEGCRLLLEKSGKGMLRAVLVTPAVTTPLPAGMEIRLMLIPESTGNYQLDKYEKPLNTYRLTTDKVLVPGEESLLHVRFINPGSSAWMKLELDPQNRIDEFCEANNIIAELIDARPGKLADN